jgi:hypothetical protein
MIMKTMIKEDLNTINGGMTGEGTLGGSKFNEGDRVASLANPDFGIGTVTGKKYYRGWHYYVENDKGGKLYPPENDLQPVLFMQVVN